MTDELKPCPFCGGEAELMTGEECAQVQCLKMKFHLGPYVWGDNDASMEAIAAWNTRTPPKADARIAQARNDALEEAALWLDMIDEDCAKGIRALKTPEGKL